MECEPVPLNLTALTRGVKVCFCCFIFQELFGLFYARKNVPKGLNRSRKQLCVGVTRIEINSLVGAKAEAFGKLITGL